MEKRSAAFRQTRHFRALEIYLAVERHQQLHSRVMRRRRLATARLEALAEAKELAPKFAGVNRPVDVVAAMVFILNLFIDPVGSLFR